MSAQSQSTPHSSLLRIFSLTCCFRKHKKSLSFRDEGSSSDVKGLGRELPPPPPPSPLAHQDQQREELEESRSPEDDVTVMMEDVEEGIGIGVANVSSTSAGDEKDKDVLQRLHLGTNCDIQHPTNSEKDWVFTWTHWMSWDT